jgi:transcriptional regulator with XRE-family HTH domain
LITQAQLAKQVAITSSFLATLEAGKEQDGLLFKKLAAALGVTMEMLVMN